MFEPEEVDIVVQFAAESAALADAARTGGQLLIDPALIRLLPDAYPDDPAASAEFRRYTTDGLAERKALNARIVIESLSRAGTGRVEVRLDDAGSAAWLRTITDIRLVLGARLGIVQDGDEGDIHDEGSALLRAVFDWLAFVQDSLVVALTPRSGRSRRESP
uniref:DUF2017 family protein n=1 Tax=Leifsonia poae TaxID=110933 RepID=UPI001CBBD534|nr:DUF2017 family protein [Leifsonia poae]